MDDQSEILYTNDCLICREIRIAYNNHNNRVATDLTVMRASPYRCVFCDVTYFDLRDLPRQAGGCIMF